jgi:hypothetical protein
LTAVQDNLTHHVFLARFIDIETGFSVTRPFQQRKSQTLGKKMDADRQADIVFYDRRSFPGRLVNARRAPRACAESLCLMPARHGHTSGIRNRIAAACLKAAELWLRACTSHRREQISAAT